MRKNRAFTLAELVFVFAFIGVISVIAMHTMNDRFVDFFTRYYTAYDALKKAVYNTYIDTNCKNDDIISDCQGDEKKYGRPFPETPEGLCKRLSEYLNVSDKSKCTGNVITTAAANEFYVNNKDTDNLQMKLSNGFKLYFSTLKTITINHTDTNPATIKYFIVYVDLNGDSKPNTTQLPHPDIVPFIATTKGDVIPVGYPISDKTYASARVLDANNNQTISYTIDEARRLAYGNKTYTDMPETMIGSFHDALPANVKLRNNDSVMYNIGEADTAGMDCSEGTYSCVVKIDENAKKY